MPRARAREIVCVGPAHSLNGGGRCHIGTITTMQAQLHLNVTRKFCEALQPVEANGSTCPLCSPTLGHCGKVWREDDRPTVYICASLAV